MILCSWTGKTRRTVMTVAPRQAGIFEWRQQAQTLFAKNKTQRGQFYSYCNVLRLDTLDNWNITSLRFLINLKDKLLLLLFASKNVGAEDIFKFTKFNTFIFIDKTTTQALVPLSWVSSLPWHTRPMTGFHTLSKPPRRKLRCVQSPGPCSSSALPSYLTLKYELGINCVFLFYFLEAVGLQCFIIVNFKIRRGWAEVWICCFDSNTLSPGSP